MKTILIDDEPQCHQALESLLKNHFPELELTGTAFGVKEGVTLIKQKNPDLIFLDIQMPDGTGFDLLESFYNPPSFQVIFVTAHNEYALPAIQFGALAYLLKPISKIDLDVAISRARHYFEIRDVREQLLIMRETLQNLKAKKLPSRMGIPTLSGVKFIFVKDIIRLEAHKNYTQFILTSPHKKLLASINIGEYSKQFAPYFEFMKVHRSHLVNLNFVDSYIKSDGGYLEMMNGDVVAVSKAFRTELLDRMNAM
ncbi:MAG: response regulator transcription factor [Bacteroidetes bacterium]|nr:response regulator transcription factor [Bacteroidota bacterium]